MLTTTETAYPGPAPRCAPEWLAYYRWVSQQILTIVDVETTGSQPYRSRLTEISVIRASLTAGIIDQQTTLLNAGVTVPAIITQITGITQAMVDSAPAVQQVLPAWFNLLSQGVLTAHNLRFDYGFLQAEYRRLKMSFVRKPTEQFCTVLLSRILLADLPSRSLPALVAHFQFPIATSHRAAADTLACWLLAQRLLLQIQQEPDAVLLAKLAGQWIDLADAAKLLGCSQSQAAKHLCQANIPTKNVGRTKVPMYQRGAIEQLRLAMKES